MFPGCLGSAWRTAKGGSGLPVDLGVDCPERRWRLLSRLLDGLSSEFVSILGRTCDVYEDISGTVGFPGQGVSLNLTAFWDDWVEETLSVRLRNKPCSIPDRGASPWVAGDWLGMDGLPTLWVTCSECTSDCDRRRLKRKVIVGQDQHQHQREFPGRKITWARRNKAMAEPVI